MEQAWGITLLPTPMLGPPSLNNPQPCPTSVHPPYVMASPRPSPSPFSPPPLNDRETPPPHSEPELAPHDQLLPECGARTGVEAGTHNLQPPSNLHSHKPPTVSLSSPRRCVHKESSFP